MEMTKLSILKNKKSLASMNKCIRVLLILVSIVLVTDSFSKDNILVIRQDGKDFIDALKGLSEELKADFNIKDKVLNKKSTPEDIATEIKNQNPKAVVLMDNPSIILFRKYQGSLTPADPVIPSVSLMGVMVKSAIEGLKNASGISYEIPIVTSIVSLRSVLGVSMKKVGVIHREFLDDFLIQNKEFCKREGIELVEIKLPNNSDKYKSLLKDALNKLIKEDGIEALWVPNDNAFLQPDIIQSVWVPVVKKSKIPVVVGVEVLVKPQLDFGTFAVLPDHVALGNQAAEMIYDLMDNDWTCEDSKVDPPLAVYKIINLTQAKRNFKISDENLKTIDKKVK